MYEFAGSKCQLGQLKETQKTMQELSMSHESLTLQCVKTLTLFLLAVVCVEERNSAGIPLLFKLLT